ncbi:hypothetical protein IH575_04780 [Candidatus Dojkabacteria bacterium]|nr:hypothetical protein [Candidatus Dojkabacteria bacterium]
MMFRTLVIIAATSMIVSKLGDIFSTIEAVKSYHTETNPIARPIMKRYGVKPVAWAVWVFESLMNVVLAIVSMKLGTAVQILYVLYGIVSTTVLWAVTLTNFTDRFNPITRVVANVYYWMGKRGK